MANEDLSKLKIDKSARAFRPTKRKKLVYGVAAILIAIIAGFLYLNGFITPAIPVEVARVSQVYPSQTISRLNASGYVVAQRKAAVASKVTGLLVSLMVEEGSRVKGGHPTILVADEPTGDLDRVSAEEVLDLMERLNAELRKTIIMVTHDPRAAKRAQVLRHLEKGFLNDAHSQSSL